MAINFSQVLAAKKKLVWPEIEKYLGQVARYPSFMPIPRRYHNLIELHQQMVANYPQRKGKYVRPTLVLLTAAAMGFPEKKAIKTAAAMQISEDWILNHDDIEDKSLMRRGQPTLHRQYSLELALNAGDSLHLLMWRVLADNIRSLGIAKGLAIVGEFQRMLDRTTLGQTIEIKWTQENKLDLTDKDILFIAASKTADYTIAGPMRLGAILAGATASQLKDIYRFGQPLGYCFQIRDDLLDLTSNFAGLKKQQGNDIYEGKRTIMLMHLIRHMRGKNRRQLLAILRKSRQEKNAAEVKWVIGMMKKYGSLDHGRQLANKFARQAKKIFQRRLGFLRHQPARSQLEAAIEFILDRSY